MAAPRRLIVGITGAGRGRLAIKRPGLALRHGIAGVAKQLDRQQAR